MTSTPVSNVAAVTGSQLTRELGPCALWKVPLVKNRTPSVPNWARNWSANAAAWAAGTILTS